MHKSLETYAAALSCSAAQVRRHIRAGIIPSAQLVQGGTGRPHWTIGDTSAEAIAALRAELEGVRPTRRARWRLPIFQEPVKLLQIEMKQGRACAVSEILLWNPTFRERKRDWISVAYDVIYRFALLRHGLTVHDLRCPPTYLDENWMRRMLPAHQRLIKKFEKTVRRFTVALLARPTTYSARRVNAILQPAFDSEELTQASALLASYHRQHGIALTHVTLATVLGMSKSALYRRYGQTGIRKAKADAHKHANSRLQTETHAEQSSNQPGRGSETLQQATITPTIGQSLEGTETIEADEAVDFDLHCYELLTPEAGEALTGDQMRRAKNIREQLTPEDRAWLAALPDDQKVHFTDYRSRTAPQQSG